MINCTAVGPNADLNSLQYRANSLQYRANSNAPMIHGLQIAHKNNTRDSSVFGPKVMSEELG